MKRFSPKQTLSNIKTAVRETVDFMNMKNAALVALACITLIAIQLSGWSAEAGKDTDVPPPGPPPGSQYYQQGPPTAEQMEKMAEAIATGMEKWCPPKDAKQKYMCDFWQNAGGNTADKKEQQCDRYAADIKTEAAKAKATCQKAGYANSLGMCYGMIKHCNEADGTVDADYDGTNTEQYCSVALANNCPGLPRYNDGTDFRQEEKETERDRKEAKRDVDDLMKDLQQHQREQAKNRREALEAQQDNDKEVRDRQTKLSKEVVANLENVSNASKEAYSQALAAASDMELQYVQMRAEARAATDSVEQAKDDLMSICRVSAEKKYQEAEKARIAALAARKKNLGAGTAVSGNANRTKAAVARARAIDYNKFFTECTTGNSPDGVGGTNAIKTKMRAQASANALMQEKATLIEKRRAEMLQKLSTMETESKAKDQKIQRDADEQLAKLNEDSRTAATRNAQRVAEQTSADQASTNLLQNKLQQANTDLMKSQTKAASAADRSACAGRVAQKSESRRDKTSEGFDAGHADIEGLASVCLRAKGKSCGDLPGACDEAINAKDGKDSKGQKVKPKSFDFESYSKGSTKER